ncbi:sugar transferase [Sphingomonas asaccharolytica]|uniref:sugar transferase n=1 Tax=Sphingomonas asaccharolytica TaxID=40681 RepID=UPI000830011C|nr:sugar transferase [Sphingomonas asaccharolytica]
MLMSRAEAATRPRSSIFESFRVEAFAVLVLAVLVPSMLMSRPFLLEKSNAAKLVGGVDQVILGAAIGAVLGLFLLRRVTAFPGSRVFSYIVPSYATSYGLVFAAFFFLRLDYSRAYLGTSFVFAAVTSYAIHFYLLRATTKPFYIVPFGKTAALTELPYVEWIPLTEPVMPPGRETVIVADLRYDHDDNWERMLAEAAVNGHPVYHVKQIRESLTGRVSIEHLSENSFGSLLPNLAYRKMKRGFDLLLTLVALPILIVPMLLIALLVKIDSEGPVLFKQERMGYRGRPFMVWKFRTMRECTSEEAARDGFITIDDDQRVTRLGRFLRRTRIDELPQMWNIIKGEMSWIGPRPEAVALSTWYEQEIPFYSYRHIVRPGISGWAQVNQGHVADLASVHYKLNYDFFYIKHFSGWLDLLILLKTVGTVVSGFGAK